MTPGVFKGWLLAREHVHGTPSVRPVDPQVKQAGRHGWQPHGGPDDSAFRL